MHESIKFNRFREFIFKNKVQMIIQVDQKQKRIYFKGRQNLSFDNAAKTKQIYYEAKLSYHGISNPQDLKSTHKEDRIGNKEAFLKYNLYFPSLLQ